MKLFYKDPKKKKLQRVQLFVLLLMSPGFYFGFLSAQTWRSFSLASDLHHQAAAEIHQGEFESASANLEKAVSIFPEQASMWSDLALSYSLSGKHEQSLNTYQRAIELLPEDGDLHRNLAMAYHDIGEHQKELHHAELANTLPTSDELFTLRVAERARWEANGKQGKIVGSQPLEVEHHHHDHGHDHPGPEAKADSPIKAELD